MRRVSAAALAAIGILNCYSAQAQAPAATPLQFEVASLKPSQPGGRGGGIRPTPGGERYVASNIPLKLLITVAYRFRADQVVGGPAWIGTDLYDINAKAERPSSIEALHLMLQNLLAERFKLQFHRETKVLPIYALMVDKGGAKLQPHEAQSAGDRWIDNTVDHFPQMTMHGKFVPMDYFAWRLSMMLESAGARPNETYGRL